MTIEVPGALGQQFQTETSNAGSGSSTVTDRNVNNICDQTGEEFSNEFLRDRTAVRSGMNLQQPWRVGLNFNQNHRLVYEDHNTILGLRRADTEDVSDFVLAGGPVAKVENQANCDSSLKNHMVRDTNDQRPIKFFNRTYHDWVTPAPNGAPFYVMESPHKYHPYGPGASEDLNPGKMKFLCSFAGRILPRPVDGKLRYVGGETRIISIRKNVIWEELMRKTSAICNYPHTIRYQLPGEDLDALISVCSDEDLLHMIEEYEELERSRGSQRLRIFLVSSSESEKSNSFEGRNADQSNAGCQYVFAVNGMLDVSPRKSSSGQSVASQSTQLGNASDYSPTFHRDSPTSVHTLERKEYSPTSANLVSMFQNPAAKFIPALTIPENLSIQSPSSSPVSVQHREAQNLHVKVYAEQSRANNKELIDHFVVDKQPYDNSYFLNVTCNYDNPPHGPVPLMNYQYHNQYKLENNQTNKSPEMHFHNRNPSGDFVPYLQHDQIDMLSEKPMLKERALSDSQLQEHDEKSTYCLEAVPHSWNDVREKSPSLAISFSSQHRPVKRQEVIDEIYEMAQHENQPRTDSYKEKVELNQEILKWMDKNNAGSDKDSRQFREYTEVTSYETATESSIFPVSSYKPQLCESSRESQDSASSVFTLPVNAWEYSTESTREHRRGFQLELNKPVRSQSAPSNQQCVATEATSQPASQRFTGTSTILSWEPSGTFGTVYYGKWRGTDVAIKRIKKSCFSGRSSEQERLTKDFWREAQILSTLHHPNVVAFYGVVPDGPGGTMATVAEYMVNGSLRHVLQRKDRSVDRRKKLMITLDAAFGMEYLHLKNIVHFDLKCDNLLVNLRDPQRPICKVGDFGLSRIKRNTLVSGGVRGTLPWMAPELLNGSSNRVSEKVDVFSFGVAMWEILTGEEPYANMHCGAIIGGIVNNTLRPPVPERCDSEWRKLMEECWSFEPTARPSFTEIVNRLRSMSAALQPKRRNYAIR
ncbi:uncharacterized protein LOC110813951 [Carica papaya]|uniref:uncharacterized protein LOC110813951 n=1 Tax=Carica papaya TaxID=3649 RepID=UPI000B8C6F44|nr:uncharacterized protein LOC110813951 [Carica papaya]